MPGYAFGFKKSLVTLFQAIHLRTMQPIALPLSSKSRSIRRRQKECGLTRQVFDVLNKFIDVAVWVVYT